MDPNDFETVVKLNEKDIEILGNLFAQYFVKCNSQPEPVDCSRQSALLTKILNARERQIIEARAAGRLKSPPERTENEVEPQLPFGGKPGEPVPTVDPDDVKSIWKLGKEAETRGVSAIGSVIMEQACKPGSNTGAAWYRSTLIWMMTQIAPEQLTRFIRDGQPDDAVFRAAAKVPMEWTAVGVVHKGPPFDVDEFLKLCDEAA